MKMKIIIAIIVLVLIFCIIGCDGSDNDFYEPTKVCEWVSPDGVHYWVIAHSNEYGRLCAPRYDNNGNLVIDDLK